LPPIGVASSDEERKMHSSTVEWMARVADQQAAQFLAGPARYLIRDEVKESAATTLQNLYRNAANTSYMLWTRRSFIRCYTLQNLNGLAFHPDSKSFIPHSSVRYDDFADQLEGKPVSLMVHPLLKLFGTNDAKDYDVGSVWAPAEVWLDSRKPTW
jgi:hypothetical protein